MDQGKLKQLVRLMEEMMNPSQEQIMEFDCVY